MDMDELLDVIRLALFECHIEHDDVEWMSEKIRRRVEEYLNGCDWVCLNCCEEVYEPDDAEKVGGTE